MASADPTLAAQPLNEEFERPAGSRSSADCAPSTSARGYAGGSKQPRGSFRRGVDSAGGNSRDAAALTRRITHSKTTSELHDVVTRHKSQFNSIHTAAAIVKLAKLTAGEPEQPHHQQQHQRHQRHHRQAQAGLHEVVGNGHLQAAAPVAGAAADGQLGSSSADASGADPAAFGTPGSRNQGQLFRSRHTPSRGAAAAAAADDARLRESLLEELSEAFLAHAQQQQYPSARQFANVVWALGSMRIRSPRQRPDTPPASSPSASSLEPQPQPGTSTTLQAIAGEPQPQPSSMLQLGPLLSVTAAQLLSGNGSRLTSALPQELSNLALGLAKLGYREVPLWAAIIAAGKARLPAFKPQELHNLAWAVAAASQDRSMISAAVQAALPQLGAFTPSGLSNLLWACATAQCHVEELFDGAAAALLRVPPAQLNSQDVANTAWAFAKVQHPHPGLMRHLGGLVLRAATGRDAVAGSGATDAEAGTAAGAGAMQGPEAGTGRGLRGVATQELVNVLWAFASMPPQGLGLPDAAAGGVPAQGRGSTWGGVNASSSSGASTSSSNTSGGGGGGSTAGLTTQLLAALLPEVVRRRDLTPQGASNALWAAGRLQPCPVPPDALADALRAASTRAASMSDQELANALWAAGELRGAGHYVPPAAVAPLFAAACCPSRLEATPAAGVAQLVSAAVKLRLVGSQHMDALAKRVMRGLGSLGPQELCVLAAAVAEAVHVAAYCNPILLNGLANAAVAQVDRLDPQVRP